MLEGIRDAVVSRIFKVKIQLQGPGESHRPQQRQIQMNAQHQEAASSFNAQQAQQGAQNSAMRSGRQGQGVQVVRVAPKVGRNDPCPCGSGKKYKNCCGRS